MLIFRIFSGKNVSPKLIKLLYYVGDSAFYSIDTAISLILNHCVCDSENADEQDAAYFCLCHSAAAAATVAATADNVSTRRIDFPVEELQ